MSTAQDRIVFLKAALASHEKYWDSLRPNMERYRNAYQTTFWKGRNEVGEGMVQVETSDGYATVESLMGSLFTKYPGVELSPDITGKGDLETAKSLSNSFLDSVRAQIEAAARMAFIYTHSFLKLAPRESNSLLGKIALRAVPPWQVILDRDAAAYEDSRFIGHVYYLPVSEANDRFGSKKWTPVAQKDYFDPSKHEGYTHTKDDVALPKEYLYVKIVEMYDFTENELTFWSPDWKSGQDLLSRDTIPVTTFDGRSLSNLVPLYFARTPDRPMEGYSTLSRVYDQIFEKNILRTFWANAVRKDSRQFLYKKDSIDPHQLAKITAGVDGAMIEVETDGSLEGLISLVPSGNINPNHGAYLQYIEQDLQRGTMTMGAVRGEASKATATEVSVLAQYTASELGKMARDRDATLEQVVLVYLRMLLPLIDDKDALVILVKSKGGSEQRAKVVTVASLDADWTIYALDGGSTPTTDTMQKAQILQLLPALLQLGIPAEDIKAEVVRLFGLPADFLKAQPPAPPSPAPAPPEPAPAPPVPATPPTSETI